MEREICPFCGRKIRDRLKHYVLNHDIESLDDFIERFEKVKMEEEKREQEKLQRELEEEKRKYSEAAGK